MAAGSPPARAMAGPMSGAEVAAVVAAVVAVYGGGLCMLHLQGGAVGDPKSRAVEHPGYWGTLPSAWDHPEPNYAVSGAIGEFWSVLTTIPVAGTLLLYQGLKYRYGGKVLCIYAVTCWMYSLAFVAHLTLQKLVFSTTVISVMSNALLTFALFGGMAHRMLRSRVLRGLVVLAAELLLVIVVATLPYALEAHGGVWTLFTVQSPGVFLATTLAAGLAWGARVPQERAVYRIVSAAGSLLSTAMVLSLIECLVGFEYGFSHSWWGFPWIHISIHILEQVGIYLFGVGVAALDVLLLSHPERKGAEVRAVGGRMVYLYCPHLPGLGGPPTLLEPEREQGADVPEAAAQPHVQMVAAGGFEKADNLAVAGQATAAPAVANAGAAKRSSGGGGGLESGPARRRRHQTPPPRAPALTAAGAALAK